jgi:hypothetical protein
VSVQCDFFVGVCEAGCAADVCKDVHRINICARGINNVC